METWLPPGQKRILAKIHKLGEPVLAVDLARALGISRQGVRAQLLALARKGLVTLDARPRHGTLVRLTEAGRRAVGAALPVLGEIAAGPPVFAEGAVEAYAERLADLLPVEPGDFLLRVRGDSMVGIGIRPGDYVVVRPFSGEPPPGAVVVVLLPGEETATLKRFYREGKEVLLRSENPAYPELRFPAEAVRVQGEVIAHLGVLPRGLRPGA